MPQSSGLRTTPTAGVFADGCEAQPFAWPDALRQSPPCPEGTVAIVVLRPVVVCLHTPVSSTVRPAQNPNVQLPIFMSPRNRRVIQAVLYEVLAIAFVGPVLSLAFDKPPTSTFALAFVLSSIALAWNYVFNAMFERWESRQSKKGRSFVKRMAHGIGFEGGLALILIPVMALWLNISPLNAFLANLSLLVFFFVYAIAFTWAFDRIFGLPESAADRGEA